jgi:hypothetical protein
VEEAGEESRGERTGGKREEGGGERGKTTCREGIRWR